MLSQIVDFIVNTVDKFGYFGIIIMMFLESSFFPFPSEVVIPPAGYLAFQGKMNIYLVVLCGIVGSILGALFNYYIASFLGRKFLLKYGKYFGFSEKSLEKSEEFFKKHGAISTFIGRLIPVIRQYISFPAGLTNMKMSPFLFFTALGSGIWVIILALIGYFVGGNGELIKKYSHEASFALIIFSIIIVFVYIRREKNVQRNDDISG
jgi:membrane protein DedA with SNARE-associated domain